MIEFAKTLCDNPEKIEEWISYYRSASFKFASIYSYINSSKLNEADKKDAIMACLLHEE